MADKHSQNTLVKIAGKHSQSIAHCPHHNKYRVAMFLAGQLALLVNSITHTQIELTGKNRRQTFPK